MVTTAIDPKLAQHRIAARQQVLKSLGATAAVVSELLAYNHNLFDWGLDEDLAPEPHVATWQEYLVAAQTVGVWETLRQRLVQLQFPVQLGISETAEYLASTRRGVPVPVGIKGVELRSGDRKELFIHQSWAGPIPVIFAGDRADFELLVQALLRRNEPVPIPAAMGACAIAGFNNWDRIASYRRQWELAHGGEDWDREWQRLIPQKTLYQDRFILLSDSPYSNVAAAELGIEEELWQQRSRQIRLEHESIHYWTKRRLGSMQNKALDELIADYWGLVVAMGDYQADWFLRFLGLEQLPNYRSTGRLSNYRGQSPLSDGAFEVLQSLVVAAARNLERVHRLVVGGSTAPQLASARYLVEALSHLTLEEIAAPGAVELLPQLIPDLKHRSCRGDK
jgi:hypothetical protein